MLHLVQRNLIMNRSKLMNHINHLAEEIKVLNAKKESLDLSIRLLESRIAECKDELEESSVPIEN